MLLKNCLRKEIAYLFATDFFRQKNIRMRLLSMPMLFLLLFSVRALLFHTVVVGSFMQEHVTKATITIMKRR